MKNVYEAYRWRYALFMYPVILSGTLLARYLLNFFYPDTPYDAVDYDAVDMVFFFGGNLALVLMATSVIPIEQSNIEVSGGGVVGPVGKGLFNINAKRKRIDSEDIDLTRSKCRFFRAYLRTYDGQKMLVSSALGMAQMRNLFAKIRKMKG